MRQRQARELLTLLSLLSLELSCSSLTHSFLAREQQPPHRPCLLGSDCIYGAPNLSPNPLPLLTRPLPRAGHVCPYDERCTWNPCKFSDEEHPNKTALERRSYALRGRGRGGPRGARGGYQARGGREGTRVQSWRKSAEEDGWGS